MITVLDGKNNVNLRIQNFLKIQRPDGSTWVFVLNTQHTESKISIMTSQTGELLCELSIVRVQVCTREKGDWSGFSTGETLCSIIPGVV